MGQCQQGLPTNRQAAPRVPITCRRATGCLLRYFWVQPSLINNPSPVPGRKGLSDDIRDIAAVRRRGDARELRRWSRLAHTAATV
ncbi:hypothetical protein GCM10009647_048890 [Streptomyces sanglieri]